ncbi:MAG: CAP domain-containing protein [Lachnospiraceae bacterium]|nr:CAP domain-containing protein [Lachnospiraceae bacterium]
MKMKRIVAITAVAAMLAVVAGCGAKGGALDQASAKRPYDPNASFIPDDAVAMAANPGDPVLLATANEALDLVNEERGEAGLSDLSWSNGLAAAANVRAEELTDAFSHTRPDGTDWYTVDANIMFGENLAEFYNTPEEVVDAWMNSPSHKENIMDGEFSTCGIAIYKDGGEYYWAQEFGY